MMHYPKRSTKAERAYVRAVNELDRAFDDLFDSLKDALNDSPKRAEKRKRAFARWARRVKKQNS